MSTYNVRLYEYADTQQVRIYRKPVTRKEHAFDYVPQKRKKVKSEKQSVQRSPEAIQHSLDVSMNRTIQSIYDILRSNRWDYFITLTLDPQKIDRVNYPELLKVIRKWFNNIKSRKAPELKYIIIPELHKDGVSYHFHGLLADTIGLTFVDSGINDKNGNRIYNLEDFGYGFTTATKVNDTQKVSSYITKYITKDLMHTTKGKRRYLASKNCNRANVYEYNMTPEEKDDILFQVSDDITFMNTQHIGSAGQLINYLELKK